MKPKTRQDLCQWIVEALGPLGGSAKIDKIKEYIWEHHADEIRDSGNLHFTWNEDILWAATQLRSRGVLKKSSATPKSVWSLV